MSSQNKKTGAEVRIDAVAEQLENAGREVADAVANLGAEIRRLVQQAKSPSPAQVDESYLEDQLARLESAASAISGAGSSIRGVIVGGDGGGASTTGIIHDQGPGAGGTGGTGSSGQQTEFQQVPGAGMGTAGALVGSGSPAPNSTTDASLSSPGQGETQASGAFASDLPTQIAGILADDVRTNSVIWGSLTADDRLNWDDYSDQEKVEAAQAAGVIVGSGDISALFDVSGVYVGGGDSGEGTTGTGTTGGSGGSQS